MVGFMKIVLVLGINLKINLIDIGFRLRGSLVREYY